MGVGEPSPFPRRRGQRASGRPPGRRGKGALARGVSFERAAMTLGQGGKLRPAPRRAGTRRR
ncbi:glucosamine--fructose-6-phosphate aminotransferase [Cystobacter fuscus DSM 2262]|uniref:Glucosamine--fructose-6-phosphate aminotransferase n=1 Tax=Cystobacter fuscus (strain ATCC 25194 / DSM 2262 / NBRC 100088 / M29) TaxID=1242864 RepID=S9Q6M3_CYSF2|nr:glucosamine--fructose-6-phosphate aminotransferase [Cystobacter fuscus DSM 2262]